MCLNRLNFKIDLDVRAPQQKRKVSMMTSKKKKATVTLAMLLLIGSVAAAATLLENADGLQNANQRQVRALAYQFKDSDVTLNDDLISVTDWSEGQKVKDDIYVQNHTSASDQANAYVRISIKEYLEFTNKTETYSDIRYVVDESGDFVKFSNLSDAQAYAAANNLTTTPDFVPTTAFEGNYQWFIPTAEYAIDGQYGKFLVISVGDGQSKSIIDENVGNASNPASGFSQEAYTLQTFQNATTDINAGRYYDPDKLVKNYPVDGGIVIGQNLTNYITWNIGPGVTTLSNFNPATATTAQWVVDTQTGWAYWSQALQSEQSTSNFLDSLTLAQAPHKASLYYAIHINLDVVDSDDIDTMAPPTKIKTAWENS